MQTPPSPWDPPLAERLAASWCRAPAPRVAGMRKGSSLEETTCHGWDVMRRSWEHTGSIHIEYIINGILNRYSGRSVIHIIYRYTSIYCIYHYIDINMWEIVGYSILGCHHDETERKRCQSHGL